MTTSRPSLLTSRRSLLGMAGALALSTLSCSKPTSGAAPASSAAAAAPEAAKPPSTLTVGFIYVGPKDDYGYNQAHAEGAKLLFPTSFGYFDPHILKMAEKYPDVVFLHCGGMYVEGKTPKNVGSYFGYIDEGQYVSGIVAGLTSKTNKLGFVAAKPIPQVL